MKGLVIIPAHNEEPTIAKVIASLHTQVGSAEADVLVVNDCSRDATAAAASAAGALVCSLPCNLGYPRALKTGLRYGLMRDYVWFAFMDADGQHRAEDMAALIRRHHQSPVNLIVGSRWLEAGGSEGGSSGRRLGMLFFAWLARQLTGRHLTDTTSGMKLVDRRVAAELLSRNFGDFHAETLIYLHDRGYSIAEVPIRVKARTAGTSMYSLVDSLLYPTKNLILIAVFKLNSWTLKRMGG